MTWEEPLAWVIGAGGLLGSHLVSTLARVVPRVCLWRCPVRTFTWDNPALLALQLTRAVGQFGFAIARRRSWTIFWVAGGGVVGSTDRALEAEFETWRLFLNLMARHVAPMAARAAGLIFFASSAGGVYGGNRQQPLTEESQPDPISPYGRIRLRQEELLRAWARERFGISFLVGRISNLFGPGQNLAKSQGLLSHISRCLIYNRPLHLYVPLDTIRDYVPADACAAHIVRCAMHAASLSAARKACGYVKVMASEQETSLAQIIATFARVSHRHPKLICAPSPVATLQPGCLTFRSLLWRHLGAPAGHGLHAGIKRLHDYHLALHLRGKLPPPDPFALRCRAAGVRGA